MSMQERIRRKLVDGLEPQHLDVIDETHGHNVPAGSESHFRVIVVSESFEGQGRLARHRAINGLLAEELAGGIHALAIEAVTPSQWVAAGGPQLDAPPCRGGSRREQS